MPASALNLNLNFNAEELEGIRKAAALSKMSMPDFVCNAVKEYAARKQPGSFNGLTDNIEEASPEESAEILALIDGMTEDDWETVRVDNFIPMT